MNLFKSELFNSVMLQEIQPRPPRSYRMPAYGRRYGRRAATIAPAPIRFAPRALAALEVRALDAGTIERIGDACAPRDYDQAA